jgi:transposase-like protein
VISRWFDYWLRQDWRRMLSQRWGEVLTLEVQQRVIESWVKFPWWSARQAWQHLRAQGSAITLNQVKQIGRESGWTSLREALSRVYVISAESFRPRDEWLTGRLLAQVQRLVEQLEALGGLTPEQQIALADLEALCEELDLRPAAARRPLPGVLGLEHVLFGQWVDDGTVRCTGQMLGVSKMTAYRWVSGFGYELLPMAALFGVVRSSGVVGVDEKYVLVPKNDKPEAEMKRWMYVYFAVDCYTYDLLHIEIYPYNTKQSAHAFLLALRAKGYHPRVIVTDMRVDYTDLAAHVFPQAVHHECIFHALQEVHKRIREVYGTDYPKTHPEVATLTEEIDHIFDAHTKRTAQRRYEKVLAQQEKFVALTPEAHAIFAFLERHWPRLVNATESRHIPTTNNATEEVIRIFTQHYKTFCGFENIETARLYLGVFEKVYRFTPFSDDAQTRIRGKCPLELAGYEVQKLPMAQLFRGLALQWPASAFQEFVPNV